MSQSQQRSTQQVPALVQIGQLLTGAGLLTQEALDEALLKARERGLPIGTELLTLGWISQRQLRAAVEAQSMVNDGLVALDSAIRALAKASAEDTTLEHALEVIGALGKTNMGLGHNRLGELLISAGFITQAQLADCLTTTAETGMPLGRVLKFKHIISDDLLLAALKAQRMIREGSLTRDGAMQVLKGVRENKTSMEQGLVDSGIFRMKPKRSMPVGYLLVETGFISEVDLMSCVEASLTNNRPIIDVLVEQGLTNPTLASACVAIQRIIDAETLGRQFGMDALRLVHSKQYNPQRAIAAAGLPVLDPSHQQVMQDLLVLCGLGVPGQLPVIVTDERAEFEIFAAALRDNGASSLSEQMIDALARALYLIDAKILLTEDAVMALHYAKKNGVVLDDALAAMGWMPADLFKK